MVGLAENDNAGRGAIAGALTVISTRSVAVPPTPVQDRLKLVSAVKALIVFEPEVFLLPVQPPEAEQLLALALLQVRVVEPF